MKQFLTPNLPLPRVPVMAWYVLAVICWGGTIASLPGYYLWFIEQPIRMQFDSLHMSLAIANGVASLFCAMISLGLATFLFIRKPGDRAALFASFYLLTYGFIMSGPLEMGEYLILGQYVGISYRIQAVLFTGPAIILLLIFPNGIITPARFRWLIPFILLISLFMGILPLEEINSFATLRSKLVYSYTGILFLCALGAQVYRYLAKSSLIERQQTKIVVFGIAIQFLLLTISTIIFLQLPSDLQTTLTPDQLVLSLLWWISITILPISFTIAVFRSHLWDIDVVIRRTIIYGILTVTLGLVYFSSVVMSQQLFRLIAGHESPIAIVISTLAIAALFNPLRTRIQAIIDRRFYRGKYNSEQELACFQQNLRDRVDMDQIENELTGIVHATVQPEWVRLWIREVDRD